jgi:hypothetical protein
VEQPTTFGLVVTRKLRRPSDWPRCRLTLKCLALKCLAHCRARDEPLAGAVRRCQKKRSTRASSARRFLLACEGDRVMRMGAVSGYHQPYPDKDMVSRIGGLKPAPACVPIYA